MKKDITWVSPKEYQRNRTPQTRKMKLKPKQYCKVLKGKHVCIETDRHTSWRGAIWIDKQCVCGHKEVEFIETNDRIRTD